jgi:hypothetical protein
VLTETHHDALSSRLPPSHSPLSRSRLARSATEKHGLELSMIYRYETSKAKPRRRPPMSLPLPGVSSVRGRSGISQQEKKAARGEKAFDEEIPGEMHAPVSTARGSRATFPLMHGRPPVSLQKDSPRVSNGTAHHSCTPPFLSPYKQAICSK